MQPIEALDALQDHVIAVEEAAPRDPLLEVVEECRSIVVLTESPDRSLSS